MLVSYSNFIYYAFGKAEYFNVNTEMYKLRLYKQMKMSLLLYDNGNN